MLPFQQGGVRWAMAVDMLGFFPGGGALALARRYFRPHAGCAIVLGLGSRCYLGGTRPGGALASQASGRSLIRSQGGSPVCLVLAPHLDGDGIWFPCTGSLLGDVTVPCLLVVGGLCSFVTIPRL